MLTILWETVVEHTQITPEFVMSVGTFSSLQTRQNELKPIVSISLYFSAIPEIRRSLRATMYEH